MAAELLIRNASLFTAAEPDPARARAAPGCVAVRGERVVAVGDERECRAAVPGAEAIDAAGGSVLPGLIDCHAHLLNLGETHADLDLRGLDDLGRIAGLVAERARRLPPGTWILGRGWSGEQRPDRDPLSHLVTDHPVLLNRFDGHGALANAAALRLAGIGPDAADPPDGRILRDATGAPTGVLVEGAARPVREAVPVKDAARRRALLRAGAADCLALGLTGLHDATEEIDWIADYAALDGGPRVFGMLGAPEEGDLAEFAAEHLFTGDATLSMRRLRMIFDGGLGARGALLSEPYHDEPDGRGFQLLSAERVAEAGRAVRRLGFSLVVHAIGDLANRLVLDAFEQVGADGFMIEHASVQSAADRARMAGLGVIASVQPVHVRDDAAWIADRLGPARLRDAYAFRDMLDRGVVLACGSDFPVASPDPFLGICTAITTRSLTRAEALYGYTRWAARAAGMEGELGSIRPGGLADLVILDRDVMSVPADEVADTKVRHTLVGGAIRH
ncbi:amidohydrolase [Spongiactinospora sp. 9N601]|uniref:amidohydrolase n=1 Tax=Spongiactinospora sp. 9N601 TaxID=3375149 RepID=UPI00378DA8DA